MHAGQAVLAHNQRGTAPDTPNIRLGDTYALALDFDETSEYPDTLIGARFIGHPSDPQFQTAKTGLEATVSGIGSGIGAGWEMKDEWYSFEKSARQGGATVIATLDETSYTPGSARSGGLPLAMGADHPIAWTRCVGKGRSFYSAIGHRPETYSDANYVKMLVQAVGWAANRSKPCK